MPKLVAEFLNLEDSHNYTGNSFRRTSATLLADGGGDLLQLKRLGGWKRSSVVEGYIEDTILNKSKIGSLISEQIKRTKTATSTSTNSVSKNDTSCAATTHFPTKLSNKI